MALVLTVLVLVLLAAWVKQAYPAPSLLESIGIALGALLDWLMRTTGVR